MFLEMKVTGITLDPFTNMPIVILKDLEGNNAIPIWIGILEASAIATELEKIDLSRPMTHDLLKNVLTALEVTVEKIEVTDLRDNTFYALIYLTADGKALTIDSRPSDAIALALRTKAPLFVSKSVIEKSRKVSVDKTDDKDQKEKWTEILENLSPEDFGKYKM